MRLPRRRRLIAAGLATASAGAWLAGVPTPAHAEAAEFVLDPEHTSITFRRPPRGLCRPRRHVPGGRGLVRLRRGDAGALGARGGDRTASVFTNHEERDRHLRGADFLDVEEHPKMTFIGTATDRLGPNQGRIIRRPALCAGDRPEGSIKRSDFGMTYTVDNGWVGDQIEIVIGFEAIRQE